MTARRSRAVWPILSLTVTLLSLSACASSGGTGVSAKSYAVTFVGPMSGTNADLGTRPAEAVQVLFDRINSEGGVKRPDGSHVILKLTREDDQGTPQGQTLAIRKAARNADALLGGMTSSPTIAGMDIAESERIPYDIVGAISSTIENKIKSKQMKYVFHSAPNAAARATADMQALVALQKGSNFYIVSQDTDYGRDMVASAENYLKQNVKDASVTTEYVAAGTTDYSTQLLKMRNNKPKPDVIYTLLTGQEMFSFMQQKHSAGDTTLVYGGSSTPSSSIYIKTLGPEIADGTMTNSVWIPEMSGQAGKSFADAYQKATGSGAPADVEVQAYDGALMLINAVQNAKSLTRDDVATALLDAKVDGLRGRNVFDPKTHGTPNLRFLVTQIQGGSFVPLWPKQYATGQLKTQ